MKTDYLVIGAGAMGMAFTDALIDHADVHVTLVDRRHTGSGHWQDAYPFVRLHQASVFYGVASTVLGTGAVQTDGPETGLQERASQPEIQTYYDDLLRRRFAASGKVTFLGGHEYRSNGASHVVTSLVSGAVVEVEARRVVDATYIAPTIPATTPPPFAVGDDVPVVPINELARLGSAASTYVIVGSGKTATDGIVWLLSNGVAPDRIMWVRPREPWMLNRAVVQPDPLVALGLSADTMEAAAEASSLDDLFLRLEAAGVMLRVDRDDVPTMAKTPTLATWELDLLRTIERVVRHGHIKGVSRGELVFADGAAVPLDPGSLVVHCAASGLQYPPVVPLWGPDKIRIQTSRSGFPCFNAALAGYVEATRDDDRERNRLCPPNNLPNDPMDWAQMQVRGTMAARTFGAEPDIAAWANACALNPARVSPEQREDPAVQAAFARVGAVVEAGLARLSELSHEPLVRTDTA